MKRVFVLLSALTIVGAGCLDPFAFMNSGAPTSTNTVEEAPAPDIAGTWRFRSVQQTGAVLEDVSEFDMRITFHPEASWMDAFMCNHIKGSYSIDDSTLVSSDAVSTKKYCEDNRGYAETSFASNLAAGFKITREGDTLTLVYNSTTIVLERVLQEF